MPPPSRSKAGKSELPATVDFPATTPVLSFVSEIDLFRHVLATGGTGCGKTLSVVLPLLEKCIGFEGNGRKAAVFVCDVKGDLTMPVREMVARSGRQADLVEISPDSGTTIDALKVLTQDPLTGGALLYRSVLADTDGNYGQDNAYWEMGAVEYLASALAWMNLLNLPLTGGTFRLLLGMQANSNGVQIGNPPRKLTVRDLNDLRIDLLTHDNPMVRSLADQLGGLISLANLESKTWSIFQSIIVQITGRLSHPLIARLCADKPTAALDHWLRDGKIFLVRLPFDLQPLPSNFLARLMKMALFKRVLTQPAAAIRPGFFVIDEAHRFITGDDESGDHNFIDRCRAFRSGCVYATQSLNPLQALMHGPRFDGFLANINTRLFGRTLDLPTSQVAANLLGDVDLIANYRGVQCVCVPDPDPDEPSQPTFDASRNGNLRLSQADLASLAPGEFYYNSGPDRGFVQLPPWQERMQLLPEALKMPGTLQQAVKLLQTDGTIGEFKQKLPLVGAMTGLDDLLQRQDQ